ncbi:DUF4123 domain-containing protein [Pseudomonas sp. NPDC007930]|uniref:DUF4123 domain-containing protein n=1 Tax=Pseudomonas sp. NPDC007930 TaxID=3364417 RepID=UPI0036E9B0B7
MSWLAQLTAVAEENHLGHFDLLLDQTGLAMPAVPGLCHIDPPMPWHSLFTGSPEQHLLDSAPLLMRIDLGHWRHIDWAEQLIEHCGPEARLLALLSPLPFSALATALSALAQAALGGQRALLRYYDPRVFPELMGHILAPAQRECFLATAWYWSWLDRDGVGQWLRGNYAGERGPVGPPMAISDEQLELIGCISEAEPLLALPGLQCLAEGAEQRFQRLYRYALQASRAGAFGPLEAYVLAQLAKGAGPA